MNILSTLFISKPEVISILFFNTNDFLYLTYILYHCIIAYIFSVFYLYFCFKFVPYEIISNYYIKIHNNSIIKNEHAHMSDFLDTS